MKSGDWKMTIGSGVFFKFSPHPPLFEKVDTPDVATLCPERDTFIDGSIYFI